MKVPGQAPSRIEDGSPVDGLDGFQHRFVRYLAVPGVHAVVGGEGPAVVLLHGWPLHLDGLAARPGRALSRRAQRDRTGLARHGSV